MKIKKYEGVPYIKIISPDNSREEFINNKSVVELSAFLLENKDFMVYAGAIIDECVIAKNLGESRNLNNFMEENFGDELPQEEANKNSEFINKIFSLYASYSNEGKMANIRGAVLERITLLLVLERYMYSSGDIYLPIKKESLSDNCQLDIDCKVELSHAGWTTKNPIDIAGWDQNNFSGEVYECKIKKSGMEESDDEILYELDRICKSDPKINTFRVGVVTFSNVEYANYFTENEDKPNSSVRLYGRNNIEDLSLNLEF